MNLAYDLYTPPHCVQQASEPIILLHSIVETKATWKPIALSIATSTGRRVYAIDLRNHGDSPWTDEYSVELMYEDLKQFFECHGIQRAILIGHSLGGKVAMILSLKEPSKVEKLIVEDSPVQKIKFGSDTLVASVFSLVKQGVEELKKYSDEKTAKEKCRTILRGFAPILAVEEYKVDAYPFECLPFRWEGNYLKPLFDVDTILNSIQNGSLELQNVKGVYNGDTLFIIGRKSQFKVHTDQSIEKHFPRATKVMFENSGHLIHETFPDDFLRTITDFINHGPKQQCKY